MTIRRALSCRAPAARGIRELHVAQKIAFFDIGLIVDIIVFERERIIRQQQEAIRELSTPVLQIRERLLQSIRVNRARVVVMDVTGVATIDSNVANHLLQTVTARRA